MHKEYLTTKEAAQRLKLSTRTLENYRRAGDGPAFIAYGRAIRYDAQDIDAWAESRKCTATREVA